VAKDTVASISPGDSIVDLSISVMMFAADEGFLLKLQLISAHGDTVYRGGPVPVTPGTSAATAPEIELPLEYDGPGKHAASVRALIQDTSAFVGDTLIVLAMALDSAGQPIDSVPIEWSSMDASVATATSLSLPEYNGEIVGVGRGTTWVVATLPTGQADSVSVSVQPVPSAVVVVSGDAQSAVLNTALSDPIVLEVRGDDGLGVSGVPVTFSTADGGNVTPDSGDTDTNGQIAVQWTLGSSVGAQTLDATVLGFGIVEATISATSLPGPPTGLVFVAQPSGANVGAAILPAVEVEIIDEFGNRATNDSSTSVDIAITGGTGTVGATLTGTLSQTVVGGLATFDDLMIDRDGRGYTLDASLPSVASVTSSSFDVILQLGLVSHWAGDGDATDSTDGNDGVLQGGIGFARGLAGEAFSLDGVNDFVNAGNATNLQLSDSPFSVSAWVLVNGASTDMSIVDKMGSGINQDGWRLFRQYEDRFWFCLGGGATNGCIPSTAARTSPVAVGLWYHVAAVKSTDSIAIYMNGVLHDQMVAPPLTDTHAADLNIGRSFAEGSYLDGLIDDVRVYAGALNATQVDSIFNVVLSAAPSRLEFTTEPTTADSGATLPVIEVTARGPLGNVADTYTGDVTLAIGNDPSGSATLSGTTTVAAVGGVAQFTDLSLDRSGVDFTLVTTATGFEPDTSTAFEITAASGIVSWTNASGGNWNVGSNWSTGEVPTVSDSVVIDLAGTYTVTVTSSVTVATLDIGGTGSPTLTITGNGVTLAVTDGMTNAGTVEVTQSYFSGVTTELAVSGGTLTNTGLIRSLVGSTTGTRRVSGRIDNQGTIQVVDHNLSVITTDTVFTTAGTLDVASGLTLTLDGTSVFGTGTTLLGTGTVNAVGEMSVASDVTFPDGGPSLSLNGSGAATVQGPGGVILNSASTWGGSDVVNAPLTIGATGSLVVQSGSPQLTDTLLVESGGLLSVSGNGVTMTVAGGGTNAGTVEVTQSYFSGVTTELAVSGGTLTNTGLIRSLLGSTAGTRTITAQVVNRGTITIVDHNLTISGQLVVPNTATAAINGGAGYALTVAGLDVDGMTVDDVRLISTNGTITRFDNVTFGTFATTTRQLSINHPGDTAFTFNNLVFNTTPTTGFHISANDNNGAAPFLTIQLANPNPGTGIVEELNGAIITWPYP